MIQVSTLIKQIETQQTVDNKAALSTAELAYHVESIAELQTATEAQMGFIANNKYAAQLDNTKAGVVILSKAELEKLDNKHGFIKIVVASPYLAYASCSQLFDETNNSIGNQSNNINATSTQSVTAPNIHPTAVVAKSAHICNGVQIGAYCVVGEYAHIGAGSQLSAHVHIEHHATLGNNCVLMPKVTIAHNCILGDYVRIHTGASIGAEGFGFAPTADPADIGWERIAQLGRVLIGNHVRIGANTCIDRGALNDTVIADNVIIDNLVQIAHNVQIGAGTAIAAKTGIAGSTHIGKRCIIGGAVGINGHIHITDDVTITAMSMVTKSITQAGRYSSGIPLMPSTDWRKSVVMFKNLWKKK